MVISLEGMEFFSRHGVHPEEREKGNYFTVDLSLYFPAEEAATSDDLSKTLDYSVLYQIVKQEMEIPSLLLESVAKRIHDHIADKFPESHKVKVSVAKHNPPIGGKCSKAKVIYQKSQ